MCMLICGRQREAKNAGKNVFLERERGRRDGTCHVIVKEGKGTWQRRWQKAGHVSRQGKPKIRSPTITISRHHTSHTHCIMVTHTHTLITDYEHMLEGYPFLPSFLPSLLGLVYIGRHGKGGMQASLGAEPSFSRRYPTE